MKRSWKREGAGIGVYMHAAFLLLIGSVALSHCLQGWTLVAMLTGTAFILALLVCVVLPE